MIPMMELTDAQALKALIDWQAELGADTPLGELPVDRYAETAQAIAAAAPVPRAKVAASPAVLQASAPTLVLAEGPDPVAEAEASAAAAADLDALRAAMDAFGHCDLKLGARGLVFSDGTPGARVMIVGEAPGREEDLQGKPFVGPAGTLLDLMLAAIGLSRQAADPRAGVYITNLVPWRPPQNRAPTTLECRMMAPFARRHIALAAPDVIVLMGNTACEGLLDRKGITRLRGQWTALGTPLGTNLGTALGDLPCLPMLHPAYLLRNPAAKREAWADLLALRARLGEPATEGATA